MGSCEVPHKIWARSVQLFFKQGKRRGYHFLCTRLVQLCDFAAHLALILRTVVGDNINIMKTTFELNFDFYQAFKQHGYTKTKKQREDVNSKSFYLITCKLVI